MLSHLLDYIFKEKIEKPTALAFVLIANIYPGFAYIYLYRPEDFLKLGPIQLFALSIFYSVSIFLLLILTALIEGLRRKVKFSINSLLFIGSISTLGITMLRLGIDMISIQKIGLLVHFPGQNFIIDVHYIALMFLVSGFVEFAGTKNRVIGKILLVASFLIIAIMLVLSFL